MHFDLISILMPTLYKLALYHLRQGLEKVNLACHINLNKSVCSRHSAISQREFAALSEFIQGNNDKGFGRFGNLIWHPFEHFRGWLPGSLISLMALEKLLVEWWDGVVFLQFPLCTQVYDTSAAAVFSVLTTAALWPWHMSFTHCTAESSDRPILQLPTPMRKK